MGMDGGHPRRDPLALVCLCLAIALLFSAEWSGKSYFQLESAGLATLASEALNVAAYTACALLFAPLERLLARPRSQAALLLGAGALATLGRLALASAGSAGMAGTGLALHSLCEPVLLMSCLFLLTRDHPRSVALVMPASFIVAGLAMTFKQAAILPAMDAAVSAGPLLAAALLLASTRLTGVAVGGREGEASKRKQPGTGNAGVEKPSDRTCPMGWPPRGPAVPENAGDGSPGDKIRPKSQPTGPTLPENASSGRLSDKIRPKSRSSMGPATPGDAPDGIPGTGAPSTSRPAASPASPSGHPGERNRPTPTNRPAARLPMWLFVLMLAYDLVYHLIITVDSATSPYGMLGLVALSAVALLLALAKGSSYSPLPLDKAALPCVAAALMCMALPQPGPELAALLSNTGSAAFYLFAIITFVAMCHRREFDAVRSLGALLAVEHVGHLLGDAAGMAFIQAFPGDAVALQVLAAAIGTLLIVIATCFFNDLEVARVFGLVPGGLLPRKHGEGGAAEHARKTVAGASEVRVMSSEESVAWQCATAARLGGLTMREEEVLGLMMRGLSNQQIAQALTVSPGTVKTHVSHICHKLGCAGRDEAVAAARRA